MNEINNNIEFASCETCQEEHNRTDIAECEGCNERYCYTCYKKHFCGVLTDRSGNLVEVGMVLRYYNTKHTYIVAEILGTFTKNMICYGEPVKGRNRTRIIIRPRLMEAISS